MLTQVVFVAIQHRLSSIVVMRLIFLPIPIPPRMPYIMPTIVQVVSVVVHQLLSVIVTIQVTSILLL